MLVSTDAYVYLLPPLAAFVGATIAFGASVATPVDPHVHGHGTRRVQAAATVAPTPRLPRHVEEGLEKEPA